MLKKAKINVMVIIGMMVAVGTVAFTAPKEEIVYNLADETWYYNSNSMADEDLNNPTNYVKVKPGQDECNEVSEIVCSIQDIEDSQISGQPALSHGDVSTNLSAYQPDFREEL